MMFNPLALMDEQLLLGLVNAGNRFYVRQSYPRGASLQLRSFVLSHYNDYFRAKEHFDVLSTDPYRYIYSWENDTDRLKLETAASQPEGFVVHANLFRVDWEKQLTTRLQEKIRDYVRVLGWKPSVSESIEPQFYPHFGEVYISMKYRGREVRIKFDEIENAV